MSAGEQGNPRRMVPSGLVFTHWRAADGWNLRSFNWPAPGPSRGSILFLGGRGDFVEKYLEALGHWHGSAFSLAGFDWRGQGGSGRQLDDPLICHAEDFDALLDDLDLFFAQWRAEVAPPHLIVAHSMGANLVLRLLAERKAEVAGAALLAPMIRIAARGLPLPAVRMVSRAAILAGFGRRRLWNGDIGDVGGRMTSCRDRRDDKAWWKAKRPELASGAPSWGWLNAACRSMARIPLGEPAARIATPLLLLASERDPVIDLGVLRRFARRLPAAELRLLPGTGHELLREADPIRIEVLAAIDRFFAGRNRLYIARSAP